MTEEDISPQEREFIDAVAEKRQPNCVACGEPLNFFHPDAVVLVRQYWDEGTGRYRDLDYSLDDSGDAECLNCGERVFTQPGSFSLADPAMAQLFSSNPEETLRDWRAEYHHLPFYEVETFSNSKRLAYYRAVAPVVIDASDKDEETKRVNLAKLAAMDDETILAKIEVWLNREKYPTAPKEGQD